MCAQGFHLTRRQLDVLPDPEEAYARRGAPWTFNAGSFFQAVLQLREEGWSLTKLHLPFPGGNGYVSSLVLVVQSSILQPDFNVLHLKQIL